MVYKRSSMRYAHTTGHTGLTYTSGAGEFILTCGSDGDIRKWRGIDDDDPTSNCLGEFVNCIAHTDDKLFASTDRNTVQRYTFPELDMDGTLMRFTAPVTCARVLKDYIAAGSEDTCIKVLYNGDIQSERQFEGHTGPVLALDISDLKGLLASVGGDGQLKIWNLETGVKVKSLDGLARTNSFESTVCYGTPTFEPRQQQALAYVKGREIVVVDTTNWEPLCTLADERTSGTYTCCRFSHDGQYLAAGSSAGEISVFDFVRKQLVKCETASGECQGITCLAWHPAHNNELAYCDATGQLGTLFASGAHNCSGTGASADITDATDAVDFGDIEFGEDGDDDDDATENDNDEDADNENCVSIDKLKSKVMRSGLPNGGDAANLNEDSRSMHSEAASGASGYAAPPKRFKQQAPFQPSSTPAHLEHRYLAWNEVGIVTAHAATGDGGGDGSIDVEFHDASVHHSLHIPNYSEHTMASLSTSVLALASTGATKLVCIALAGNKEWSLQLPDCESVEALAATTQLVGVVTNMRYLRLFTVLGTQREVLSLPGAVVAMAGHAERLVVVYHAAPSGETQQHLAALLIRAGRGLSLRCQDIGLPLAPGRQLSWLGFSDCGSPCFADSMGLLQLYSAVNGCWHPVCDTLQHSQSVSNNYFVVAVSERSQIVQAALCRGVAYPMTNPRPMTQELPMQLPLCDADTERAQLEDTLVRAHMMRVDGAEQRIKETAIKLFALACRSEMEARAKELIATIGCPELLLLAVKYASKLGRIHLSDRLSELRPAMATAEEEQQQRDANSAALELAARHSSAAQTPLGSSSGGNGHKLAPRVMELSSSKRALALKRFAMAATTPPSGGGSRRAALEEPSPAASQENIFSDVLTDGMADNSGGGETDSQIPSTETQHKLATKPTETAVRSPLNPVNPFAAKRKIADADFLSSASGLANKFKMAKK